MTCECPSCRFRKVCFNASEDTELHRLVTCKDATLSSIRMLLDRENPNSRDGYYDTPLHLAAFSGKYEIAKQLINAGAEVNAYNSFQNTPLHIAVIHQNRKVTELLLQSGADANSGQGLGNKPLHLAVRSTLYMKVGGGLKLHDKMIVKMLIQAGADVNCTNRFNETPLLRAVKTGDFDIVQILLLSGANANICDTCLISCLHVALFKIPPNHKLIEELIKYGAIIHSKDKWSRTPLNLAILRYFDDPSDELKTAKIMIKMSVLIHSKESFNEYEVVEETVVNILHEFHKVCSQAVCEMMALRITKDVSLYDFALRGINCRVFSSNQLIENMYSKVLTALLQGKCGIYRDIVELYFPKLYLKKVLKNIRIVSKDQTNQREIELMNDVIWVICDFLTQTDLLRLIRASFIVGRNYFIED